ncbi:unnamed protein product [Vitrella brassicaformis CCMP3155]|uniref:Uncharacterized protein n=3 Tax=Vitrella brassicaformis TaxID=1169539 RepID=A0A0G4FXZ6_VITBC|nr:unnamed protein product [Vitrella brassicaformis CCMP3155]|eukprot:CEM20024.1 unnamed protein product [Vitrella brassicaformis CCMP3155]
MQSEVEALKQQMDTTLGMLLQMTLTTDVRRLESEVSRLSYAQTQLEEEVRKLEEVRADVEGIQKILKHTPITQMILAHIQEVQSSSSAGAAAAPGSASPAHVSQVQGEPAELLDIASGVQEIQSVLEKLQIKEGNTSPPPGRHRTQGTCSTRGYESPGNTSLWTAGQADERSMNGTAGAGAGAGGQGNAAGLPYDTLATVAQIQKLTDSVNHLHGKLNRHIAVAASRASSLRSGRMNDQYIPTPTTPNTVRHYPSGALKCHIAPLPTLSIDEDEPSKEQQHKGADGFLLPPARADGKDGRNMAASGALDFLHPMPTAPPPSVAASLSVSSASPSQGLGGKNAPPGAQAEEDKEKLGGTGGKSGAPSTPREDTDGERGNSCPSSNPGVDSEYESYYCSDDNSNTTPPAPKPMTTMSGHHHSSLSSRKTKRRSLNNTDTHNLPLEPLSVSPDSSGRVKSGVTPPVSPRDVEVTMEEPAKGHSASEDEKGVAAASNSVSRRPSSRDRPYRPRGSMKARHSPGSSTNFAQSLSRMFQTFSPFAGMDRQSSGGLPGFTSPAPMRGSASARFSAPAAMSSTKDDSPSDTTTTSDALHAEAATADQGDETTPREYESEVAAAGAGDSAVEGAAGAKGAADVVA